MRQADTNPARIYLPLLVNPQLEVRQQTCLIMLGTYGERALTYLRRLLDDPQVREDARLALLAVEQVAECGVRLRPFKGLHIECLGRLRVCVGSYELQAEDWAQANGGRAGWQKVQGVLAYLVHCGRRGASRDALGAAAWGGGCTTNSLARTLTALRQALAGPEGQPSLVEQALVIDRDHCMLDPDCYQTDVQRFECAFDIAGLLEQDQGLAQAAPVYAQALQLYTGPYMAGVPRASAWGQERRDHLMSSFVIAAERLAEHAFARREFTQCVEFCTQALDADPSADDVVVWLLRAYAAQGRRADFEHAYRGYLDAARHSGEDGREPVTQAYRELSVGGMNKT